MKAMMGGRPATNAAEAVALFSLLTLLLLFAGALLRELPCFFTNQGGVPLALRDLLRVCFWPVLGVQFALLVALTVLEIRHHEHGVPWRARRRRLAPVLWMPVALLAVVVFAATADNLFNLAAGLPMHHDAPALCH